MITRIVAAGGLGALLGWLINRINAWGFSLLDQLCRPSGSTTDQCANGEVSAYDQLGPAVECLAVGLVATIVVCLGGFAVIRLRPLSISVLMGVIVTVAIAIGYVYVVKMPPHVPQFGPAGAIAAAEAAGFLLLAALIELARRPFYRLAAGQPPPPPGPSGS